MAAREASPLRPSQPLPPERTSGTSVGVDSVVPTEWSDETAEERREWVGMHGWYY